MSNCTDNLTLGEIKELMNIFGQQPNDLQPFEIGKPYFIRTVTMHYTGRVVAVGQTEIILEDAAWIADSGRFHDALKEGNLSEVEPFIGKVIIGRGALIDATPWEKDLPRSQK